MVEMDFLAVWAAEGDRQTAQDIAEVVQANIDYPSAGINQRRISASFVTENCEGYHCVYISFATACYLMTFHSQKGNFQHVTQPTGGCSVHLPSGHDSLSLLPCSTQVTG
jgi:hypothetical protein